VYFVEDNGAGFDMKYAGKLFGVFERSTTTTSSKAPASELAIVQLSCSGTAGASGAEAAVDRGATFYFTFPNGKESIMEHASVGNPARRGQSGGSRAGDTSAPESTISRNQLHIARDGEEALAFLFGNATRLAPRWCCSI